MSNFPVARDYPEGASYHDYVRKLATVYPEWTQVAEDLKASQALRQTIQLFGNHQGMDVQIFDIGEAIVKMHHRTETPTTRLARLEETITTNPPPEIKTRIIQICRPPLLIEDAEQIDNAVIGIVGKFYKLNPQVFWSIHLL